LEETALADAKKNAARRGQTIVFIDESGLSERPTVARTWAPRGQTPVIQYSFNWKQLSAIAGLTFWRFYFRFFPGTVRSPQLVEFLQALRAQLRGKRLLIVWDGLGTHRSRLVRRWLETKNGDVQLEFLPPYAPELNPVEQIWNYLKNREIPNLCAANLTEVADTARRRLKSMQRRPRLLRSFWQQAELAF
jgi:transposase